MLADATEQAHARLHADDPHVRRSALAAVGYLHRHDGDADAIAPNLYAGKSRRRPTDDTTADPTQPAQTTGATAAAPEPIAGTNTTTPTTIPGLSPAAVAAAVAAQKGAPASKGPFLS